MKLLIDPQIFEQKFGGISRYYTEIIREFKEGKNIKYSLPIVYTENLHLLNYHLESRFLNELFSKNFIRRYVSRKALFNYNKQYLKWKLKKQKFDLFIPTYYDLYFLDSLRKKPFVLTVYDMIHELYPQFVGKDTDIIVKKKLLIEKATRIIAISQNTKNDIISLYPHIDESKIVVVYLNHSVDTVFNYSHLFLPTTKQYVLYVGNRSGYKNFEWFIKNICSWIIKNDVDIICAGGNKLNSTEEKLLKSLGIESRIFQIDFNDNELAFYYKNALTFVFPSIYEGFGIPILEAMASDCPVIIPISSSFPEVAGDAALYYNPDDHIGMIKCLDAIKNDSTLRSNLISMGKIRLQNFSWSKTAKECIKVYNDALK